MQDRKGVCHIKEIVLFLKHVRYKNQVQSYLFPDKYRVSDILLKKETKKVDCSRHKGIHFRKLFKNVKIFFGIFFLWKYVKSLLSTGTFFFSKER